MPNRTVTKISERRPKPSADPDRLIVPPPSQPMAVARELVTRLFRAPAGLVLHEHRGNFYNWNGHFWPELPLRDLRAQAYQLLEHAHYIDPKDGAKPWAPSRRKIDDLIDALRAAVALASNSDPPFWTDDRHTRPAGELVSMTNGVLHVPTRTLYPASPHFFTHHALPFPFEPDAAPPAIWLRFLDELWNDDPASIDALQEICGYVLGGDTRLQKIFLLVGPPRSGKGTIGRVLTGLLGAHNVAAPTLAGMTTNFGLKPLIGCPLALVSDARLATRSEHKIIIERLLSISGEDSLTIDRKFEQPWTGRLPTRFVILTNELPRLVDASGALASRFVIVVLTRSFFGRENPALTEELLAESPGLLNWALDGLDRLMERGHFIAPESGRDALQQIEDLSAPVSAFLKSRCVVRADTSVPVDTLWAAWKNWCDDENRLPGDRAMFGRDLRAAVHTLKRIRSREGGPRAYTYTGVGLVETTMPDP